MSWIDTLFATGLLILIRMDLRNVKLQGKHMREDLLGWTPLCISQRGQDLKTSLSTQKDFLRLVEIMCLILEQKVISVMMDLTEALPICEQVDILSLELLMWKT